MLVMRTFNWMTHLGLNMAKWAIECLTEEGKWLVYAYAENEKDARSMAAKAMTQATRTRQVRFREV